MSIIKKYFVNKGMIPTKKTTASADKITYYNWWDCDISQDWFYKFIKNNNIKYDKINLFSVFGSRRYIDKHSSSKNIFFTGEDVYETFPEYSDHCVNQCGLSLGFADLTHENYMRFPLWITYVFAPVIDKDKINNQVMDINNLVTSYNNGFIERNGCVLICRNDIWNTRTPICDGVNGILDIKYAGKFRNNTTDLWKKFNDDKISYLKNFKFNICPENHNRMGYVTEKIFEAFLGGCIPIYTGSDNRPEEGIINNNAVLFWDLHGDNSEVKDKIDLLNKDDKYYLEFIAQNRLHIDTVDFVYNKMCELKERIELL